MRQKNVNVRKLVKELESSVSIIVDKIEIDLFYKIQRYEMKLKIIEYKSREIAINKFLNIIENEFNIKIEIENTEYFNEQTGNILTNANIEFYNKR